MRTGKIQYRKYAFQRLARRREEEKRSAMDTNIQTQMFRYKFGHKCSEQVDTRGPDMHQITLDSFFVRTSMSETCYRILNLVRHL